jgi:hypothetical protein
LKVAIEREGSEGKEEVAFFVKQISLGPTRRHAQ